MQKKLIVVLLFAVGSSPLLIIGLVRGVIQRNIQIAGRPEPLTGRQAVAAGIIFILGWCVMVSAPFWIEAVARR